MCTVWPCLALLVHDLLASLRLSHDALVLLVEAVFLHRPSLPSILLRGRMLNMKHMQALRGHGP